MSGPKDYSYSFDSWRLESIAAARRREMADRAAATQARVQAVRDRARRQAQAEREAAARRKAEQKAAAAQERARQVALRAKEEAERLARERQQMEEHAASSRAGVVAARSVAEAEHALRADAGKSEVENRLALRADEAAKVRRQAVGGQQPVPVAADWSESATTLFKESTNQTPPEELEVLADAWEEFERLQGTESDEQSKRLAASIASARQATRFDAAWKADLAGLLSELQNAIENATRRHAETLELVTSLAGWQKELQSDADVNHFQFQEARTALQAIDDLTKTHAAGMPSTEVHARAEKLHAECQQIFDRAGELQAKFKTRNELLADVIDSLKKIGFFVSDPCYENENDPTGPVIVKAVRADETMTTSIDLSETVRSVWNGIADEKCATSFFDYLDEMGKKGVSVSPLRADLQQRPQLLQKGAKSLPRSTDKQHGA